MCAIFGLGFQRGHNIYNNEMIYCITRRLFEENMERGSTASGAAFCSTNQIHVIKSNVCGKDFVKLPEYNGAEKRYLTMSPSKTVKDDSVSQFRPVSVLGHCRLKTKGSELDNVNNHPIVRDNVVGVHNGIISNDDALFRLNKANFERNGEVDSEILFALIDYYAKDGMNIVPAIQKTVSDVYGSFACAMVHRYQNYVVYLFRNSNPCIILHYKDTGLIVWSSMERYITKATRGFTLGEPDEIVLNSGQGIAIDLFRNRYHRFSLEEKKGRVSNA